MSKRRAEQPTAHGQLSLPTALSCPATYLHTHFWMHGTATEVHDNLRS